MKKKKFPSRTRAVTWEDPMIGIKAANEMSGLNYLSAIANRRIPAPPFMEIVGFKMKKIGNGHVVFELKPAEYQYNLIGNVHGGVASTLLDSAMASAIQSMLPLGVDFATIELNVSFVRPLTVKNGMVDCDAKVVYLGRRMATAEGKLLDKSKRLYAHGTLTCLIIPRKEAQK